MKVRCPPAVNRGADAPLGTYPPQAARQRSRWSRCHAACSHPVPGTARHAPCFYSSPLDAARSKGGAGPRRLMLGTLAARLCFRRPPPLPPPAWARSSVGPPERRAEDGCLVAAHATTPRFRGAGSFRPSTLLRFRGRAKRKKLRIDGLYSPTALCRLRRQQPAKTRAQAVRPERPHSLLGAPFRRS